MKNNRTDTDWIEDFLDGTLDDREVSDFKHRLESDPEFAEKYQQRMKLQETWQDANDFHAESTRVEGIIQQERFQQRSLRNTILIAASVIIVAGIASILLFVVPGRQTQEMQYTVTPADSNQKQGPQQIGIPKYAKHDSVKTSLGDVQLILPKNDAEFAIGDSIRFQWESEATAFFLSIKENNTGRQVIRIEIPDGGKELVIGTDDLSPGTYSWHVNDSLKSMEFKIRLE